MKVKILLVEDEEDTADLLKNVLEREGFLVIKAKDGRQASTFVDTIRPPALVLLDLVIPYVSGSELLKVIRQHPDWQHIPIIVVSADSHGPDIQQAMLQGATAYVLKQKGLRVLLEEVRRILHASGHTTPAPALAVRNKAAKAPRSRTAVGHRPRGSPKNDQAA